ncbi:MAG: type I 3-dehydroquinate dehydratase [Candidatus Peregrinibacteria bacterium]|nr:type I 3-dehydroquinate dehydratase [Candidatus Peregrinibacteria bacterium]
MFVVTLPSSAAHDPLTFAKRVSEAGADLLEIRGDLTPNVPAFNTPLPLIVSPRNTSASLITNLQPSYIDLELGETTPIPSSATLIRSFHDYEKTPSLQALLELTEQCRSEGADIIKIVTTINAYDDLATLERLHAALPKEQKRIILGMGIRANYNRILSPFRNELTYTYVDEGEAAASGQVALSLYKKTAHCKQPLVFGILGSLNVKSGSPLIQNALFAAHDVDAVFTAFLSDNLDDAMSFIKQTKVQGLSVTTPFKKDILSTLDDLDPLARELQSVNTVVREDGEYKGYNKDEYGIREGYDFIKEGSAVAILGSGGVVPAVIHACKEKGIQEIQVFARSTEARLEIEKKFSIPSFDLSAVLKAKPDVLICAVNADVPLPIPSAKPGAHALDLRYGKATLFLKEAEQKGYQTHDGIPMLLQQALGQFQCFTGITPSSDDSQFLQSLFPMSYGKQ